MAIPTKSSATPEYDVEMLDRIVAFLNSVGIPVTENQLDDNCFLPGMFPKENGVLIDRARLKYPGDLLHEAGHVAVTEAHFRPLIGTSEMPGRWPNPGEEFGAILWSYAAVRAMGIPAEVVFHADGYKGDGEWLIEQFENKNYIGLPLFAWMGFCSIDENADEQSRFPNVLKWLR
ncbi:hypothetical protein [Maribellus sediminis]|uniref:hypothetical protein n=1 Tax=Maribellus sediminis TaxID=2696285 RepID=UPI001980B3F8|nr:hypothetical protein [Maribellus sediminis]